MKILLVEDHESVARFIMRGMNEVEHEVDHSTNGADALRHAAACGYDVIVLDRMLPGSIDGLGVIGELRNRGDRTPVLILSALGEVDERIRGLKAGGDDYLVKPFAFGELLARIEALSRRSQSDKAQTVLAVGDLVMDLLSRKVSRGSKPISLKPREFELLEYLMRHADQIVTRAMMLEDIWQYDFDPQTNVIDVHVSKLRNKIDAGFEWSLLRTVRNAGYILTATERRTMPVHD
jgi:two-component system OmpR family response regulator